jgi:hypothetical protein
MPNKLHASENETNRSRRQNQEIVDDAEICKSQTAPNSR